MLVDGSYMSATLPPGPDPHHILTGRPGPISIRFDISDARIEQTQQRDKYVVRVL